MKFRELCRELEAMGFVWSHGNGGHQIYKHTITNKIIVVPKNNLEIGKPIVKKMLKQAKLLAG